jgi:hypothetical protein
MNSGEFTSAGSSPGALRVVLSMAEIDRPRIYRTGGEGEPWDRSKVVSRW